MAALDTGSAFGGFGASREVTLAMLVEPAIMLSLASLGCLCQTSNLNTIFSYAATDQIPSVVWLLAGTALFLASLVEFSRMPIDDPTTHLELTMVHEAMILENSGPNLALTGSLRLLFEKYIISKHRDNVFSMPFPILQQQIQLSVQLLVWQFYYWSYCLLF